MTIKLEKPIVKTYESLTVTEVLCQTTQGAFKVVLSDSETQEPVDTAQWKSDELAKKIVELVEDYVSKNLPIAELDKASKPPKNVSKLRKR